MFFLIDWLSIVVWVCVRGEGGRGSRLKVDVQRQGGERILDVDGQEGEGSWKLTNFHGRHVCIIPYQK